MPIKPGPANKWRQTNAHTVKCYDSAIPGGLSTEETNQSLKNKLSYNLRKHANILPWAYTKGNINALALTFNGT